MSASPSGVNNNFIGLEELSEKVLVDAKQARCVSVVPFANSHPLYVPYNGREDDPADSLPTLPGSVPGPQLALKR